MNHKHKWQVTHWDIHYHGRYGYSPEDSYLKFVCECGCSKTVKEKVIK